MNRGRRSGDRPREGLAPIAAAFAVFALLIQALLPAAALAATRGDGPALVVCTLDGSKTVFSQALPQPKPKGFAGLPCQDCLVAVSAFLATPVLSVEPGPAVFVRIAHDVRPAVRLALARAPPRPFGQGPPIA